MSMKAIQNRFLIVGALVVMLGGCSTAASMRVEVEVYKGPLVQPRPSQYAELAGTLMEARNSFEGWSLLAERALKLPVCKQPETERDCRIAAEARRQATVVVQLVENLVCEHLTVKSQSITKADCRKRIKTGALGNYSDIDEYLRSEKPTQVGQAIAGIGSFASLYPWYDLSGKDREKFLAGAVEVAARMKAKAFYTVYDELPDFPDERLGPLLVGWTTLTSTYSQELSARATTLLKQVTAEKDGETPEKAVLGRKLSVGDHLRNANPSEFLHLLDWYGAVGPRKEIVEGMTAADRVRLGQRLFADQFWSKVNEVQASGQGEVRMAFIRDAIGNWNLKEFDSNPEELLSAYRDVAKAGFELAKNAAKGAATGGAGEALSTANKLINSDLGGNEPAPADTNPQIAVLRDRLGSDLNQIVEQLQTAKTAHETKKADIEKRLRDAKTKAEADKKAKIAELNRDIQAKESEKNGLSPSETAKISSLEAEIAALQKQQADINTTPAASVTALENEQAAEVASYKALVQNLVEQARNDIRSHIKILDGLKAAEVASVPTVSGGVN
jgi:hypothetical protein